MSLPVGTALQNGSYVIDAFCFEDSLGPTYLATHVPTGSVVQIKILGSQRPDQIPEPAVRSQFQDYLRQVNDLKNPHLVSGLQGFEEEGIFYLAMDAAIGQPLSTRSTPQTPLSARQALQVLQHLRQILETLRPLGWQGLLLQPDQLWLHNRRLVLTGFGFPSPPSADPSEEPAIVTQMAQLLFFLLTGEQSAATSAPLVHLHQRIPTLPAGFEAAVQQGLAPEADQSPLTLASWMGLLPDHLSQVTESRPAPLEGAKSLEPNSMPVAQPINALPTRRQAVKTTPVATAVATAAVAAAPSPPKSKPFWFSLQAGLILTGLVASVAGLGFGLTLRLHGAVGPTGSRLNPEQAFPPLPDWSGDDPVAEFDTPYLSDEPGERVRPEVPRDRPSAPEPIETPFERAPVRPAPTIDQPDYSAPVDAVESLVPGEPIDPAQPEAEPPSMADPLSPPSNPGGDIPPIIPPTNTAPPPLTAPAPSNPSPAPLGEPSAQLSRPASVADGPFSEGTP